MDAVQLVVVARQIEAQQAAHQFWYWVTVVAISFVFGAFGSFIGAYFNKRGETKAIQADLKTIIAQQKELTGEVKRVEFDLSHEEWKKRELATLRRQKLEDLMVAASKCGDWAIWSAYHILGRGPELAKEDPMAVVDSLAQAYFPGLSLEATRFSMCKVAIIQTARREQLRRLIAAQNAADKEKPPVDTLVEQYIQLVYRLLLDQQRVVVALGATILREVLGAAPPPKWDLIPMRDQSLKNVREFADAHDGMEREFLMMFEGPIAAVAPDIAKMR